MFTITLQLKITFKWIYETLTDEQMKVIMNYEMGSDALDVLSVYSIRSTKPRPVGKEKAGAFIWPGLNPLGNDAPLAVSPQRFD